MEITGSHILSVARNTLWEMLQDPTVLADVTPGVSELEKVEENKYKAIAKVKMGPVSGTFTGDLEMKDIIDQESFTLHVKQNSKIGNVDAAIKLQMKSLGDDQTEVSFEGLAQLSGLLARTGNRVLSGVANTLSKQFFTNLENKLANQI